MNKIFKKKGYYVQKSVTTLYFIIKKLEVY